MLYDYQSVHCYLTVVPAVLRVHSIINLIYLPKNSHSVFAQELNDKLFEVECGDGTIIDMGWKLYKSVAAFDSPLESGASDWVYIQQYQPCVPTAVFIYSVSSIEVPPA